MPARRHGPLTVSQYPEDDYDDPEDAPIDPALLTERALVGLLLLEPHHAAEIIDELRGGDFLEPAHETIWDAIQSAPTTDPALVRQTVIVALSAGRKAIRPSLLPDLITAAGHPPFLPHYIEQIRNASRLRTVASAGRALTQIAAVADPEAALQRAVEAIDSAAQRWGADSTAAATGLRDLSWVTSGQIPVIDPPVWGRRTDGHALFYAARVNGIFGDPESAKTWIAKAVCVEALHAGQAAVMVDVDHNGQALTVAHLMLLGAPAAALADPTRFRYYEPDDSGELLAATADITRLAPAVVVLDSIGEMLPMLGVNSVDNDEITGALRTIASAPARAGACVITIDHLPKGKDSRESGYAIGGTAKKRALDGSYIFAKTVLPPAPGQLGKVALRIEKDRPGELRKTCGSRHVGDFILDSRSSDVTKASIVTTTNDNGEFIPTHFMELASKLIEDADAITTRDICAGIRGKAETVRHAVSILIRDGYVTTTSGRGVTVHHHSTMPYRENQEEDDDPMF